MWYFYARRQRLDWLNIEVKPAAATCSLKMSSVFQRIRHVSSKNLVVIDSKLKMSDMIERNSFYSDNFSAAGSDTWFLELKPSNCNHMYLNLCNDSTHRYNVIFLRFTTAVFNMDDKVLYSCASGAYAIIPTDIPFDLLQWSKKSFQAVSCSIRITCWLEISNVQKSFVPSVLKYDIDAFRSLKTVVDDLKAGLTNLVDADVILRIKSTNIIKVHKHMLRARSPVFKNMFGLLENRDIIVVDIKDINVAAVTELVSYIYTGSKNVLGFRDTMDLYYAAGKYEIKCLKDDCRNDLMCHLQVENACDLFVFAYQNNDKLLEEEIVSFLNNNFEEVVNTKSFEELSKQNNIVQSLLRKHFVKFSQQ